MDFWPILFGHWMADYMLQPKKMAIEKSSNWKVCFLHCLIYSGSVGLWYCLEDWHKMPTLILLAFATHFPIDFWSLADVWLKLIKGRDVMDAFKKQNPDPFASPVYIFVDNGMHLALLYLAMRFLL